MQFQLPIQIPNLKPAITHQKKLLLIGSCFTEHITHFLARSKFQTMQNSHGILFNPLSVCKALDDVAEKKVYTHNDLFQQNEYWHSWYHHSDFSFLNAEKSLENINKTIETQHDFLKEADYVFITLGSAFAYYHLEENIYVSNNHRAPAAWFRKDLLSIETIQYALRQTISKLKNFNPSLQFVFTISPVRHSRDGVIENNRSKARLIEAVHSLHDTYYFPAYELLIDILRDYRFYDADLVHPNYQATSYVWEQFITHCIDSSCIPLMKHAEQLYKARHHKSKDIQSMAHKQFLQDHLVLSQKLQLDYPFLNFEEEIVYFSQLHN
jgi:hypothetical protein